LAPLGRSLGAVIEMFETSNEEGATTALDILFYADRSRNFARQFLPCLTTGIDFLLTLQLDGAVTE
jgi:hypothetical protein